MAAFVALLACFWANLRRLKRIRDHYPEWRNDLLFTLPAAVGMGVFLLLFMGNFGHNLFRFTWLWYGGFLIIARYCLERRVREELYAPVVWDETVEAEKPAAEREAIPAGWTWHGQHG